MESFKWGKHYETGIALVDSQHHSLVDMINDFGSGIAENSLSKDLLLITLKKLADYAGVHFATEENIMSEVQVDLRHIKMHLQQHNDFVDEISTLAQTMDTDNAEDYRMLFEYLVHWLAYHILGADQNLARQVNAIQNGKDAKAAFEEGEKDVSSSTEPLLVALNGLFSLVSKRNKALMELNKTLEKRVAERTAELLEANEALEKLSITDHLTGLPNRRFAIMQLEQLWKKTLNNMEPLSCLMIDADNFKMINDLYGHDAGDEVLRKLGQELQDTARNDDVVCRLGGDEFVIFCPDTDLEGALVLAEETRKKIARLMVPVSDGFWHGSISVGAACHEPGMHSTSDLLKAADNAVLRAKKDGRNCVRT